MSMGSPIVGRIRQDTFGETMPIPITELPDKSLDRVLGWLEHGAKVVFNQRQVRQDKATLLANYAKLPGDKHWISLELHAVSIGLNPDKGKGLYYLVRLLLSLPPPGPARASLRLHRDRPLKAHMWGLVTDPAVGP
jgi:hypothetical protein